MIGIADIFCSPLLVINATLNLSLLLVFLFPSFPPVLVYFQNLLFALQAMYPFSIKSFFTPSVDGNWYKNCSPLYILSNSSANLYFIK